MHSLPSAKLLNSLLALLTTMVVLISFSCLTSWAFFCFATSIIIPNGFLAGLEAAAFLLNPVEVNNFKNYFREFFPKKNHTYYYQLKQYLILIVLFYLVSLPASLNFCSFRSDNLYNNIQNKQTVCLNKKVQKILLSAIFVNLVSFPALSLANLSHSALSAFSMVSRTLTRSDWYLAALPSSEKNKQKRGNKALINYSKTDKL